MNTGQKCEIVCSKLQNWLLRLQQTFQWQVFLKLSKFMMGNTVKTLTFFLILPVKYLYLITTQSQGCSTTIGAKCHASKINSINIYFCVFFISDYTQILYHVKMCKDQFSTTTMTQVSYITLQLKCKAVHLKSLWASLGQNCILCNRLQCIFNMALYYSIFPEKSARLFNKTTYFVFYGIQDRL